MRIKIYPVLFLSFAVLLAFTVSCSNSPAAPQGTSSITGNISKQLCCAPANPFSDLPGAGVELFKTSKKYKSTVTDTAGDYSFLQITAGTYDVVAVIPTVNTIMTPETNLNSSGWTSTSSSYHATSVRITRTAVSVADDETVTVDFRFMGY